MKELHNDYLILGAGPAGLQLGYELQKSGRDFLILESGESAGSYFKIHPRHRTLISINKVHTGYDDTEINLRWDWNSLLCDNDELLFKNYSKKYMPPADSMVRYLQDFAEHYQLPIKLETRIIHITRNDEQFVLTDTGGDRYTCNRLIIATGVSKLNVPPVPGIEHAERYDQMSIDPEDYAGQSVLIIGKGNSAFETADNLIETTTYIHVISPQHLRLAWESRFVGHLRAINNNFIDTYQLKCQNAVLDGIITKIEKAGDKYRVDVSYSHASGEHEVLEYDRIILAAGWKFDDNIFDEPCCPRMAIGGRFPEQTEEWESTSVPGMYIAGTLMQMRDYRKGTSSFIHGFRYAVRALARILNLKYHDERWPHTTLASSAEVVTAAILERANRTSALWQQFGFLCDLIVLDDDDNATYYEEVPIDLVMDKRFGESMRRFVLTLEFGQVEGDIFNIERNPDPSAAQASTFLHPIIRYFDKGEQVDELHLLEDLHSNWKKDVHREPLHQFAQRFLSEMQPAE